MELYEFKNKVLELLNVKIEELSDALMVKALSDDYCSLPSVAESVDFVRIERVSKDTKTMTYIVKTNERTVTYVSYIGEVFAKE